VERAAKLDMKSLALTDGGNLFGAVKFVWECRNRGIKPIIGAEVLVDGEEEFGELYDLVLLCRTNEGYENLKTIVTRANLEYCEDGLPITTHEVLSGHCAGLTALSGCLEGEIPQAIIQKNSDKATASARKWESVFGHGNFFLEMVSTGQQDLVTINSGLLELSQNTGIPLVATNNVFYLHPEDATARAVLETLQGNGGSDEKKLSGIGPGPQYFTSPREMALRFADHPEALKNTVRIADSVEPDAMKPSSIVHFPIYTVEDPRSTAEVLTDMAGEGLAICMERAHDRGEIPDEKTYKTRLEHELKLVIRLGFDSYFLVVADIVDWARVNHIPVGPGRGSGAGSLLAYAIGITDVDPIQHGLLFERFINIGRIQPPDFDIDFSLEGRQEVIDYVFQVYGHEHVSRIVSFDTLAARPSLITAARVLGIASSDVEEIITLIPDEPRMTLNRAIYLEPHLADLVEGAQADPKLKELLAVTRNLEGLTIQAVANAVGIVISDKPVSAYVPMYRTDEGDVVTQYDMKDLDAAGLIKFDFLGLEALTILDDAVKIIRSNIDADFFLEKIPLDDSRTYEMLSSGSTENVFQLESRGITDLVERVKPECFDDIVAILALYRPGPLGHGMTEDFVRFKHMGRPHGQPAPEIEHILRETYGVVLYQEQLMQIAAEVAGFSLGRADLLRRALARKRLEDVDSYREEFIDGAASRGVPRNRALDLFQELETFAEYGFNKSHSVSYGMLTYRMAYIKANHPNEFEQALRAAERRDEEPAQ